jgi:hypothetical protein
MMLDAYLLVFTPHGDPYSVLYPGETFIKGIHPYYAGFLNPLECMCMDFASHTVCQGAMLGSYTVMLAILPHGAPADHRNVLDYALKVVLIIPSE